MMLDVNGVSLSHGSRDVVRDVSLHLRPGRFLALVGPNGAGKSTLLAALAGRLAPRRGDVAWFGRPLATWPRRDLARQVALMQQSEGTAFGFLVREYVSLGRLPRRAELTAGAEQRLIRAAMTALDVARFADREVPSLSGGERQRAQMARCLAQLWSAPDQPPGAGAVLLLDEPTSALDPGQQARVLNAAWALTRRGGGCIAVLHDLNLAATYADEVAVLRDGRLVALGPPARTITAARISAVYDTPIVSARLQDGDRQRDLIALPAPRQ